jgi:hypothetical protein
MTLRQRLTAQVTDIRNRGQRLVQLNLELLTSELKEKGRKFGTAVGMFVAAGLVSLYAIGFLLATIVVLLALVLPLWASMLIVTAALFILVAILVLVGRDQFRKIGDPKPQAAIAEAEATAEMVKANARGTVASVRERVRPPRRQAAAPPPAEPPLGGWSSSPPPPPSGPSPVGEGPGTGASAATTPPTTPPPGGASTAEAPPATTPPADGPAPEQSTDPEKDT